MVEKRVIIEVHEFFYRQITLNKSYLFEPTKNEEVTIQKFIQNLALDFPSAGINFIVNYFESGWNYWYDRENLRFGLSSVAISWIIGQKAYDRWKKIKDLDSNMSKFKRKVKIDTGINLAELFQKSYTEVASSLLDINDFEEKEKGLFYNTEDGLVHCIDSTNLFNHKSGMCVICKNRNECKKILKEKFPKLNKLKGY